jgi:NADH-quinone oxidoreductase subunit L
MVTAGVYLLVRTEWLFALTPDVLAIVAWVGAFTALLAAVLACVQDDIKRVLAYSTVSQLGYMMTAIGAGFAGAGFFHLLTHGVFKALLFLGAGAVIHAVHSNDLPDMGGLARRMPQTAIVFLVGTLSLAGIPLFGGFLSKEEILGAVWAGGMPGPFALLMLVAFLTAFYMFRVVFLAFFGNPAEAGLHDRAHSAHDPPLTMLLPLWVLALGAMAIGIYFLVNPAEAGLYINPAEINPAEINPAEINPAEAGLYAETEPPFWLTPAAISVAVAGILLAWLTYQRRAIAPERLAATFGPIRRAALAKFWIDDVFEFGYRIVLLGLSRMIGWIDRYIVDGILNAASAWTLTAGDDMRSMQTGRAQDYVYAVALGVIILVIWIQWVVA